jgi:hypothetical protein
MVDGERACDHGRIQNVGEHRRGGALAVRRNPAVKKAASAKARTFPPPNWSKRDDRSTPSSRHCRPGQIIFVNGGHEIELEAPDAVIQAIHEMVTEWRKTH